MATRLATALMIGFLAILVAGCGDKRAPVTATRTLPPGVKEVTATPDLPTVTPATPTATPGIIEAAAVTGSGKGLQVTLPVVEGTPLRVVETCFWDECWGYSLPPGTPIVAPMDGKVTILPSAADTTCSIVIDIFQATDSQKGKTVDPPATVELAVGCDSDLVVKNGDAVKRGQPLLKLGQRGIYEGRGDAPPTVVRFTCQFTAKACNWAGGSPHYLQRAPAKTPTPKPTGTPTATPAP